MVRVLLLLPSTSYRAHDLLQAARRLGIDVVVGTDRRQALQAAAPDGTLAFDLDVPALALDDIAARHARSPFAAVLGVDDETAGLAAAANARLGLRGTPPAAVATLRDKWRFRQAQATAGLPHPWHLLLANRADPSIPSRVTYPCVLKPTFLSASRGVIRADNPKQFLEAWRTIRDLLDDPQVRARGGEQADAILVEDYLPGHELALEGILTRGSLHVLALFDKPDPLEGPYFEETLLVTPSRQPATVQRHIANEVARNLRIMGVTEGPVHAEVRVSAERAVHVLEVAPRCIGGHCARALRFGNGRSLEEVVLLYAIGATDDTWQRERSAAGVMMIPIPAAGILRRVRGLRAARAVPGVEAITIAIRSGQQLVPLPAGNRYLGFIFARADVPEAVEDALRSAHARLRFEIEPTRLG